MVNNRTHWCCQSLAVYTGKFPSPPLFVCVFHAAQWKLSHPPLRGKEVEEWWRSRNVWDRETEGGERWRRGGERERKKEILAFKREERELKGDKERNKDEFSFIVLSLASCLSPLQSLISPCFLDASSVMELFFSPDIFLSRCWWKWTKILKGW